MNSHIRTSLILVSLLFLATAVGHAQNRPPCYDDEGNPQFSNPGGCFVSVGEDGELFLTDFQKYAFFLIDEGTTFLRSNADGEWFAHFREVPAKVFFCDPVFAPGCDDRIYDFNAPDYAFPGELVGTAKLTLNGACIGDTPDECGLWCPTTVLVTGEVFSESGAAHDLTYHGVLAPANDPNHPNFGKCKIVSLEFTVE